MTTPNRDVEGATTRLVRSIMGHADAHSIALATRIAASTMEVPNSDLSSVWRKIERNSTDDQCKRDVELLHEQLVKIHEGSSDSGSLPEDILHVLVKLMGNKPKVEPPKAAVQSSRIEPLRPSTKQSNEYPRNDSVRDVFLSSLAVEEGYVLRECIYSLQGIDGERIRFCSTENYSGSNGHVYEGVRVRSAALGELQLSPDISSRSKLGSGAVDAIRICAEAGWLYRRVQSFIQKQHSGSVSRALASALSTELKSYQDFLVRLEATNPSSLRQILAETRMPTMRLKSLAVITDGLASLTGGPLLSALHLHAQHGDKRHASLVCSLLASASRPWFDMLYLWTTQGILSDPANEFFVAENEDVSDLMLWHDRFKINYNNIPTGILDRDLIEPAFNAGKGINFIRKCLLDGEWAMEFELSEEGTHDAEERIALGYCYSPGVQSSAETLVFRSTLEKAGTLVHSHILLSLREDDEHCLLQHLFALKQFMLLGQGDFFSSLMDGLHAEFGDRKGVVGIYRHSLAATMETALRGTNASDFPPHVLKRLQVELLLDADDDAWYMFAPRRNDDGEVDERTVWDIFALEYTVPDPLTAIVHPAAMKDYKLMFLFLFGLKKVEFMLNYTWRQSAVLQHALHRSAQHNGINVATSKPYAQATVLLRKISMTRQAMMHFVTNLKSYLMFEVLEGGWADLELTIQHAQTLDEIVQAHDRYLRGICRKSLLRPSKDFGDKSDIGQQLSVLLRLSSEFCLYQETLFGDAQQAADRASQKRQEAEQRLTEGQWGFNSEVEMPEEEFFFGLANVFKLQEVDRLAEVFNRQILGLLRVLDSKVNGGPASATDMPASPSPKKHSKPNDGLENTDDQDDLDSLRFLTFQLDHNSYYGVYGNTS
jgi:gamma-tubulin complex component 3